jgi:hypothetical protein
LKTSGVDVTEQPACPQGKAPDAASKYRAREP